MESKFSGFINGSKIRFLIIIVAIVIILLFLILVRNEIDKALLSEKLIEKQFAISLIANQADHFLSTNANWEIEYDNYIESILASTEMIDESYMTYAAVFDENLQNISSRSPSYEGSPFEPAVFPEFVDAVTTSESGQLVLPFTPPGDNERDMFLQYQWMPSNPNLPNRVMVVVAISSYSVNSSVSAWIQVLAVALIIIAFAIAIFVWRKQMTDSLNAKLEETVQERTAKLEEQKMSAQRASMAKSEFLSNMSHEIRTPINAIIGMTSIAQNSDDISRKDYCLDKIDIASCHLLSVINDILDMSKIEANKFELNSEKFNFEKVLQKAANVIGYRVDEKHQVFAVHIDKDIPFYLMGDDQRITQIITNLLSNAVKFTPEEGNIRLAARLIDEKDNTCTIQIEVQDSGIGISPEQQAKLFSAFVQAETHTSRKFGGTGLGLALSKSFVEMMGGKIWIESEMGKGATFAFTIKAEKVTDDPENLLTQGVNWKNMKVLVVDDDSDNREYFAEIMKRFGRGCDVAKSGEEACELIEKNEPYDFYFIDWKMEGMDGIELAKHIKASEKNKSVVIMISAGEWSEIEMLAKGVGIKKFLTKPLFPSNIADCINECLGLDNAIPENNSNNYSGVFKNYHIILAEDIDINREIVVSLLEPTGISIDTAENGYKAVELFSKNPDYYDMIFMDVQMPMMDGCEATKRIRSMANWKAKNIPIVAMTANVFKEDVDKCLAAGMNDHVGKPIKFEIMISKLSEHLLQKKSA